MITIPSVNVIGNPMEKIFNWGAALVMTPKEMLTTNKEIIAGRATITAALNIQTENSST